MSFSMPPQTTNHEGGERRVGVELEFSGLGISEIEQTVLECFGGTPREINSYISKVEATTLGDFEIRLDSALLADKTYERYLFELGLDLSKLPGRQGLEGFLRDAASFVVPFEIITPPVPLSRLDELEQLRAGLYDHKARGTRASFFYAFGLHFNVEAAALTGDYLVRTMRAFLLLYAYIRKNSHIDFSRILTPYIDDFPAKWAEQVIDPEYAPDLPTFARDFLEANPTRNRALDLLPLLCFVDCDTVRAHPVEQDLVKPRPAFHYRLPNCLVDEPDWSLEREWRYWVLVEELAADADRLAAMARAYLSRPGFPRRLFEPSWAEEVAEWLG